jgi:hypothetical protein
MSDIAWGDLLAGVVGALVEVEGNGQPILEQFIEIIRADHGDGFRNSCPEAWGNFVEQELFYIGIHQNWCGGLKRNRPQRLDGHWGLLNEAGRAEPKVSRQASKLEKAKRVTAIGAHWMAGLSGPKVYSARRAAVAAPPGERIPQRRCDV